MLPDNKGKLGFGGNEKLSSGFGFLAKAHFVAFRSAVLLDVLFSALEDHLAARLLGLACENKKHIKAFTKTDDDQWTLHNNSSTIPVMLRYGWSAPRED